MSDLTKLLMSESVDIPKLVERNRSEGYPDLTPQLKAFAIEYVQCLNHMEAAESIGLSRGRGIRLMRNPLVSAMIQDMQAKMATRAIITREYIESENLELNDIAMGRADTFLLTRDGDVVKEKVHNLPVARAVQADMAKNAGIQNIVIADKGAVSISINLSSLGVSHEVEVEKPLLDGEYTDVS